MQYLYAPCVSTLAQQGLCYCMNLKRADFRRLQFIGKDAFDCCFCLQQINSAQVEVVEDGAFRHNRMLKKFQSEKITELNKDSFSYCYNLTQLDVPNVNQINGKVRDRHTQIYNINVKKNLQNRPTNLLLSESAIRQYLKKCTNCLIDSRSRIVNKISGSLVVFVSNNIKVINKSAFVNCYQLAVVKLQACQVIEESAFFFCHSMCVLQCPCVEQIGSQSFFQCFLMQRYDLPNVTEIGNSAFAYNSSLRSVSFCQLETLQAASCCPTSRHSS
uniref:Leucine rich repeats-containing protein n=1 Tax=Trepomonas sp. PC1 TaxID=1076344 RepID=A0A146KH60_9EUKA|eukprot:JAP94741.1 Leucine rich repeats-containing protein [Trepomonas sp. PC1]